MYPSNMVEIGKLTSLGAISPGDAMTASVQYGLPAYPNEFLLTLTDNTTGKTYSVPQPAGTASRSTAEWIAEAPTGSSGIVSLPTVGSVSFANAAATIGGVTGPIDDPAFQEWQVDLTNAAAGDVMTPTSVVDTATASPASSFVVIQAPEPSSMAMFAVAAAMLSARAFWRRDGTLPGE